MYIYIIQVAIAISLMACISVINSSRTRFQSVGKNYNINYNSNMNTNFDLNQLLSTLFGQQISNNQRGKFPASGPSQFYDHFHASFSSDAEDEDDILYYDIDDESFLPPSTGIPKAITSVPIAFPPSLPSVVPSDADQIDEAILKPISDDSMLEVLELELIDEAPMLNETEA